MKKLLLITAIVIFSVAGIVFEGHAQSKAPVRGGILREIWASGPQVLSYLPDMGPGDEQAILPASEKLMEYDQNKQLVPFLAESVTVAKDGKSITFKLRKGIKFTDGSDLNAEAVAWNYQLNIDAKRLQYRDKITKIEICRSLHSQVSHHRLHEPAPSQLRLGTHLFQGRLGQGGRRGQG